MINTNEISFSANVSNSSKIDKKLIFKFVLIDEKYYATDFNGKVLFEIFPNSLNDSIKDELRCINNNYAYFIDIDKQNLKAVIEICPVFNIEYVENFYLFTEDDSVKLNIKYGLDFTCVELLQHIHDKEDFCYFIESKKQGKYFKIVEKVDFDTESGKNNKYYAVIDSPKKLANINEYQRIFLYGKIDITNSKKYLSVQDNIVLNKIRIDVQNYLNLWDNYNEIEFQNSFALFKKIGHIKYDYIKNEQNIELYFSNENFQKIKEYSIADKWIMIGDEELLNLFKCENLEAFNKYEKELLKNQSICIAQIIGKPNDVEKSIKIATEQKELLENFEQGYISISLLGNKISYKRRKIAKERIINGRAGNAKLYTYFTNDPQPLPVREKIELDNRLLKNKNLTDNQLEVISIICNTPDIAVIQGPPGTGKTTTILEALTQLNANKQNKKVFGNNLLAGFRHETVLNMIDNVELFGLPAVKIGKRHDESVDAERIEPKIIKFINDLIDRLSEKYKDISVEDKEYVEFKKKYYAYVNFNNSLEASIKLLEEVKVLERFRNDIAVHKKIDEIIRSLEKKSCDKTIEEKMFLQFLYSLPLSEQAFYDDKQRVFDEIEVLEEYDKIKKDVIALKNVFLSRTNFDAKSVKDERRKLILKYREKPQILATRHDKQKIVEYLDSLFEIIRCERYKKLDGDKVAILDYIDSLTENPKLIKDTLLEYTKVLGATNQQVVSKDMYDVKQNDLLFDNVIIDEAATSSPLDLFIPMSLAKNRIVLVGDQRQLPNIVDESVVEDVLSQINSAEQKQDKINLMHRTLFEILIDKAKMLEKKDGIRRVITLNSQFRMHPALGKIVSDNFYKQDGGLFSPIPESAFTHNYNDLTNKYLHWIDVPFDPNETYRKSKDSSSRKNTPEAESIAKHIKEALDKSQKNTIGVITIYRDQVDEIKKALRNIGVFDKNNELVPEYSETNLLVGTVDAFQGREFDIVYLSMAYVSKDIEKEKNPFSRLVGKSSMSLLCVALSRQKKLLIIVGDKKLYSHELCKEKVPVMYNLAKMV